MHRVIGIVLAFSVAQPALAQQFWQSPDYTGAPLQAGEPAIGVALPGATVAEERANWAWQMRAGLNVAALQCQFDPTLMSQEVYNGVLTNHRAELDDVYKALTGYFKRTSKTVKEGQDALDRYGTKTYIGVSTVRGQLGFCDTASKIGRSLLFAPRGSFTSVAVERLRELRNSLGLGGEQRFRFSQPRIDIAIPNLDPKCWTGRGSYKTKCGAYLYS